MKLKRLSAVLLSAIMMSSGISAFAADSNISVKINNRLVDFVDQNAEIVDGRTLIPLRGVFDEMGFIVEWDDQARTALIKNSAYEITIGENMNRMYVNGEEQPLEVPAQILNDRMMIPLRALAESVNADVTWNESSRTVLIEYRFKNDADESIQHMELSEQEYMDKLIAAKSKLSTAAKPLEDALLFNILKLGSYDINTSMPVPEEQFDVLEPMLSELESLEPPLTLELVDLCVKDYVELVRTIIEYSKNHNPKNTYNMSDPSFASTIQTLQEKMEFINSNFGNYLLKYFMDNKIFYEGIYGEYVLDVLLNG